MHIDITTGSGFVKVQSYDNGLVIRTNGSQGVPYFFSDKNYAAKAEDDVKAKLADLIKQEIAKPTPQITLNTSKGSMRIDALDQGFVVIRPEGQYICKSADDKQFDDFKAQLHQRIADEFATLQQN